MPSFMKFATAALAVAAPLVSAQTYSDCNPLKQSNCPADKGSTESTLHFDFTQASALEQWKTTAGTVNTGANGAEFTLAKKGDAPTIRSNFYIWYGEISVEMKSAPGTGVVSSIVLESDTLDEVDWEALGGNNAQIETNYFGKGDTSTYDRDTWPNVATPHDVFHTYTVKWTKDQMIWSVDGNVVRTLNYADAQGGARFPQTPMDIRIGIWAGGDSGNGQGTIDWAGGLTDYSKAPFSMYIKSVTIKNDNPAQSYTYNGNSGNADSIQVNGAGVTARSTTSSEPASTSTQASTSASTAASTEASTSAATTLATSAATTLATTTQGSSTAKSTEASSTAGSSSGVSPSSSGAAGSSGSGSSSQTGSQTGSGSSSSGSGSGSSSSGAGSGSSSGSSTVGSGSSASSASASASSSPAFNAASSLASNYLGPISLMGLITAMLQL